jgi:hypothetical protein
VNLATLETSELPIVIRTEGGNFCERLLSLLTSTHCPEYPSWRRSYMLRADECISCCVGNAVLMENKVVFIVM